MPWNMSGMAFVVLALIGQFGKVDILYVVFSAG